ncbi:hypothetical protein A3K34_00265 [candidate division WWE3 bacterium RIFOXYC1_FULL_40_10]|uniref:Uncharacterized protein n=1 Tax=candidate division WWE3 bacterium RIFOXYA2_FULL_46_9 TaxID=1802636 RepID=A0A1F4W1E0_UNCKA|nr:MAG: hypothetical protein A3K58_00265 [candidate division WWE3 bacterium RIFOXYB1_FULL_40_22]OGC61327.1 MAG: hypothetical protein A3K37_00265 [candidate division WWE3 bacterium RIFOXYA1_FULL_40_11]OGC63237.1 MAG: hypothetical protein A2264_00920 [candidate division WWE3 bacterium RIFOXYA2_FULL_46_9]OGC65317.1 MAG: hypothetical protein A2326_04550 [candidate division WWE3 bacterium RIFOXYB2_FULL_41_6]OGC65710.1 MAG: hypothetical protein A3K34_00265 [candidate division WWE3 bacterium RIFOXYC1_
MIKQLGIISTYKFPLLIAITLGVVLSAVKVAKEPLLLAMIFAGVLLGTLVLELEYVLYAFVFEPHTPFAENLTSFIKHGDFANAAKYVEYHKHEITDKSLNSAVFQVIIGLMAIFVISSDVSILIKAFVLSIFANTIYKLAESYFENKLHDWFWVLKNTPSRSGVVLYSFSLLILFIYCLLIFK